VINRTEAGLAAGELPIGAVVVMGDEVVGWAYHTGQ
jgi:pyrimidine deaminase RibD-like protein